MTIKFSHTGQTWYSESALRGRDYYDLIMICLHDDDDNIVGEFSIEFHDLNGKLAYRICCFDDALEALIACNEMIVRMAEMETITPTIAVVLLDQLGYVDDTERIADGKEREQHVRDQLRRQINKLHEQTDWDDVPSGLMSIGAFRVPDKGIIVAAINVGSPDSQFDLFRAELLGTSSLKYNDQAADHGETIDLLMQDERFMQVAVTESFV